MKDETFVFYEEVKDRSITARSAHKIKRPSARPKINRFTDKEWKKLNEPVHTYNLNEPMSYEDFKAMPQNARYQYITKLINEYSIGPAAIAKFFGLKATSSGTELFKRLGIEAKGKTSREATERFINEFCNRSAEAVTESAVTPVIEETAPALKPGSEKRMAMKNVTIDLSGPYRPEDIAQAFSGLFPLDTEVKVNITISTEI